MFASHCYDRMWFSIHNIHCPYLRFLLLITFHFSTLYSLGDFLLFTHEKRLSRALPKCTQFPVDFESAIKYKKPAAKEKSPSTFLGHFTLTIWHVVFVGISRWFLNTYFSDFSISNYFSLENSRILIAIRWKIPFARHRAISAQQESND